MQRDLCVPDAGAHPREEVVTIAHPLIFAGGDDPDTPCSESRGGTEGWFVVNVRDAEWWFTETRGGACWFESEYGDPPIEFAELGINLTVLEPGQSGLYHAESNQEAFLVLAGTCRLLVEGEERLLRRWDFFHSSPWTEHAFVGAGEEPCVILMAGSRSGTEGRYPVSELAARYGASVAEETDDWTQAYAEVARFRRERPPCWDRLPWA